ncbi:MAG: hypothetical protein ACLUHE_16405 [Christensenellales bacterium]
MNRLPPRFSISLSRSILRMIAAASEQTGAKQALLAGGVASSTLLKGMAAFERARKTRLGCRLCFARPELSGDNAVGVALLGAGAYQAGTPGKKSIETDRKREILSFV